MSHVAEPARVVVTGLGAVTPVGNDARSTWRSAVEGRSGIDFIRSFDTSAFPVHVAAEAKDFVGDLAHEADAAAAVNERDAAPHQHGRELARRGDVTGPASAIRSTKHTDSLHDRYPYLMLRRFFLLLVLLIPSIASADIDPKAVDRIMMKTIAAFHIPGAAVAIVQNDRVVYAKGYGVTELGGTTPVAADTLFGIGSTTKAFTTAAMSARLRMPGAYRQSAPASA